MLMDTMQIVDMKTLQMVLNTATNIIIIIDMYSIRQLSFQSVIQRLNLWARNEQEILNRKLKRGRDEHEIQEGSGASSTSLLSRLAHVPFPLRVFWC